MGYTDYATSMHDPRKSYYTFLLCSEDVGRYSSVMWLNHALTAEAYEAMQDDGIPFEFRNRRYFSINGFVMIIHDVISAYPVIETNRPSMSRVNLYGQDYPNRRSWYLNRANLMMEKD